MNLAAVPVSVVPGFTSVGEIDSVGATTTVPLLTRSAPRQLVANAGVTEYVHAPSGTPFSMPVVAVTVPAHVRPTPPRRIAIGRFVHGLYSYLDEVETATGSVDWGLLAWSREVRHHMS